MKRIFLLGLMIVILAVVSTVWSGVSATTGQSRKPDSTHATDAAYRDGLFLGKFDAQSGRVRRVCVGRWSAETDRAAFASGYKDGYARADAGNAAVN